MRICSVGPSTAERIERYGVRVDLTPDESRAERIVEALTAEGPVSGRNFLLPRADIAREVLADQLREAGAEVGEVVAYRTLLAGGERDADHDVYRMLLDRQIDAVTFTSASTVKNFAKIYGEDQAADLLNATVVASIGPVTAEAAQQLGIQTTVMPASLHREGLGRCAGGPLQREGRDVVRPWSVVRDLTGHGSRITDYERDINEAVWQRGSLTFNRAPGAEAWTSATAHDGCAATPRSVRWCAKRGSAPTTFCTRCSPFRARACVRKWARCRASTRCRWTRS